MRGVTHCFSKHCATDWFFLEAQHSSQKYKMIEGYFMNQY